MIACIAIARKGSLGITLEAAAVIILLAGAIVLGRGSAALHKAIIPGMPATLATAVGLVFIQ